MEYINFLTQTDTVIISPEKLNDITTHIDRCTGYAITHIHTTHRRIITAPSVPHREGVDHRLPHCSRRQAPGRAGNIPPRRAQGRYA